METVFALITLAATISKTALDKLLGARHAAGGRFSRMSNMRLTNEIVALLRDFVRHLRVLNPSELALFQCILCIKKS